MKTVAERVVDGAMLALVKRFLEASIIDERDGGRPKRPPAGHSAGRRQHAPYAKGNFQFERVIAEWRTRPVLDLRRK